MSKSVRCHSRVGRSLYELGQDELNPELMAMLTEKHWSQVRALLQLHHTPSLLSFHSPSLVHHRNDRGQCWVDVVQLMMAPGEKASLVRVAVRFACHHE